MVSRVEVRDSGEITISLNIMGDEEMRHEKTLHNGSVRIIRLVNQLTNYKKIYFFKFPRTLIAVIQLENRKNNEKTERNTRKTI